MTRVAVLADIHGNLPALEAVAADFARRDVGVVINLGDHASGPLWPRETVAFLMRQRWCQLAGNCDRQIVRDPPGSHCASDRFAFEQLSPAQKEWLAALPASAMPRDDILAFHGTPADDASYLLEVVERGEARLARAAEIARRLDGAAASVMLCGHSHLPRVVRLGDTLIVNPGSVGLPACTNDAPEPHVIETGSPDARYAIVERLESGWEATLVVVPYDHAAAAERARRNARPDWVIGLSTGYMTA